jgi:hypothetical protein
MPSGFEDLGDEKDVAAALVELKRDHFISVPTSRVGRSMPPSRSFASELILMIASDISLFVLDQNQLASDRHPLSRQL